MYSKFRLIKGELDKIFVRPAIFVMTAFFIIAMVLSALVFNPSPRQDYRVNFNANSVSEVHSAFYSEVDSNRFKISYDNMLTNSAKNILLFYSVPEMSDYLTKNDIVTQIETLKSTYSNSDNGYRSHILNDVSVSILENDRQNLLLEINKLKSLLNSINASYTTLLLTTNHYNELVENTSLLYQILSVQGDVSSITYHKNIYAKLQESEIINKIETSIKDNITDIIVSETIINVLRHDIMPQSTNKLSAIESELNNFKERIEGEGTTANTNKENIKEAINYISQYKLVVEETIAIVDYSIKLDITKTINVEQIQDYYGDAFTSYNYYKYKEALTRSTYLFETNTYDYQYSNVFQAGFSSNYETGAYDYMYFAMELLSILIILFCVILGSDMIAGEQANGTLTQLAIRPYRRSKIISAKFWATVIFGLIFLVVGMIASFIIGVFTYGINSSMVLVTFDATVSFTISPLILMLIYLASLLIKILFYTVIAICLSTLFKSNIASIAISFILYLCVALFASTIKGLFIYKFIPFNNADLFKYFGSEFQNGGTLSTIFGLNFNTPIMGGMTFLYSVINIAIFMFIVYVISLVVFKKRDIT